MNTELFTSHGFELSDTELAQFQHFLSLFMTYNSHTNLSAIRDEEGIVEKHFVDSLYWVSVLSLDPPSEKRELEGVTQKGILNSVTHPNLSLASLAAKSADSQTFSGKEWNTETVKLLDIGSGGGFPGIPLKIVMPELQMTLLDSVGKKVKAMNHFVTELELTDIWGIQERAEVLAKDPTHKWQYDIVVSRATAYMTEILTWAEPFLTKTGRIVLYKMPSDDERAEIKRACNTLRLSLEGELEYELAGKPRILYTFVRRK
jgi:16S rRNA (guanine527-N7)-methyltransferase